MGLYIAKRELNNNYAFISNWIAFLMVISDLIYHFEGHY